MKEQEIIELNIHNEKRLIKYKLFKDFEKKHIGKELKLCLEDGLNSENPGYKYIIYLRYYFLPFAFTNGLSCNDLDLLAVQEKEISLIYYSIYQIALRIEEVDPNDIIQWFMQSYIALNQISNQPKEDLLFFTTKLRFLKSYQRKVFDDILLNYEAYYRGFIGSYDIIKEPYFHFKYKSF